MVTVEVKTIELSAIKLNKDNPRRISNKGMDYLIKSLQDFPEMMEMREIVVDETRMVRILCRHSPKNDRCLSRD